MKAGIYPAWDDSGIVTCLTTAGPIGKGHPNGRRKLTMREMAALQSYPNNHVFLGKQISRQIGNSVPPMIAAILLTTVRKHLEKADKVELEGFVADGRSV
jgi:DNA (cytosine-5)-methyltransferase 1